MCTRLRNSVPSFLPFTIRKKRGAAPSDASCTSSSWRVFPMHPLMKEDMSLMTSLDELG
eukprot:COSAG01_NODE_50118_length_366_cov_0.726592_2_plen_58_part_01